MVLQKNGMGIESFLAGLAGGEANIRVATAMCVPLYGAGVYRVRPLVWNLATLGILMILYGVILGSGPSS